jgi:NTP pyrophosphatase (non-canonical NTP hydrolase)
MTLRFDHLRSVNVARCLEGWHQPLDLWTADEWAVAVGGEFGEAMNLVKKLNRDRDGIIGNDRPASLLREELADELADTVIYIDLLAASEGLALDGAAHFGDLLLSGEIRPYLHLPPARHLVTAWRYAASATNSLQSAQWHRTAGAGIEAAQQHQDEAGDYLFAAVTSIAAAARHYAIVLGDAVVDKFNRTSLRHGMPHRLVLD